MKILTLLIALFGFCLVGYVDAAPQQAVTPLPVRFVGTDKIVLTYRKAGFNWCPDNSNFAVMATKTGYVTRFGCWVPIGDWVYIQWGKNDSYLYKRTEFR